MKPQVAHSIVLVSAMLTFGVGWFEHAEEGQEVPPAKFLIGAGITFLVISFIADVEPNVGGALALAIATSVFLSKKDPLLGYVNQTAATQQTDKTEKPKTAATTPQHVAPHK